EVQVVPEGTWEWGCSPGRRGHRQLTGSDRNRYLKRACRRLSGAPPARSAAARPVLRYGDGRGLPARALCTTLAPCCLSLGGLTDRSHGTGPANLMARSRNLAKELSCR